HGRSCRQSHRSPSCRLTRLRPRKLLRRRSTAAASMSRSRRVLRNNCAASADDVMPALVAGIHVFKDGQHHRRGWPGRKRVHARVSGWVLLTWLPHAGRLINQTVCEGSQAIAGGITVLALDMYEHAYHLDFGANSISYVATFMRNIDWSAVQGRYEDAVEVKPLRPLEQQQFADLPSITVEEVKAMLDQGTPGQISRDHAPWRLLPRPASRPTWSVAKEPSAGVSFRPAVPSVCLVDFLGELHALDRSRAPVRLAP